MGVCWCCWACLSGDDGIKGIRKTESTVWPRLSFGFSRNLDDIDRIVGSRDLCGPIVDGLAVVELEAEVTWAPALAVGGPLADILILRASCGWPSSSCCMSLPATDDRSPPVWPGGALICN